MCESNSPPVSKLAHPFRTSDDGVRVTLKVQPRATRARIDGIAADANGESVLRVRVSAAPEGGKANEAVIGLLAKAWGMPKSALAIISGARGRTKTVLITGEPERLMNKLNNWNMARHD